MQPELHPIDILVDLVISEEMDPWEIDIAEIANRFLEEVRKMAKVNLHLSGRTLLTSSILLRMKSDSIVPKEEPEDSIVWNDFWDQKSSAIDMSEVAPLSAPIRRTAERKTTLFELIEALQRALNEEMIRKNFPRQPRQSSKLLVQINEESIKEKIATVYNELLSLARLKEVIMFTDLIAEKSRKSVVGVLLSLLYLDSQGKITVWQKELFGELFVTLNEVR